MPNRELDLALAQQRVSDALAPDEVIAAARAALLPRMLRRTFELAVRAGPPAHAVLEAFLTRGGVIVPGTGALTPIPA